MSKGSAVSVSDADCTETNGCDEEWILFLGWLRALWSYHDYGKGWFITLASWLCFLLFFLGLGAWLACGLLLFANQQGQKRLIALARGLTRGNQALALCFWLRELPGDYSDLSRPELVCGGKRRKEFWSPVLKQRVVSCLLRSGQKGS